MKGRSDGYNRAMIWAVVLTGVPAVFFPPASGNATGGQAASVQHVTHPVNFGGLRVGPKFSVTAPVTFSTYPSPYVMVGRQLWNMNTDRPVGKRLPNHLSFGVIHALSPGGRWYVDNNSVATNNNHGRLNIWSTRTGRRVKLISYTPASPPPGVTLGKNVLVLDSPVGRSAQVFNLEPRRPPINMPVYAKGLLSLAVSPGGGRIFGFPHRSSVPSVVPIHSDAGAIRVEFSHGFPAPAERKYLWGNGPPRPPTAMTLAVINASAFSADGRRIACVTGDPARLVIWNSKGRCVTDRRMVGLPPFVTTMQWQPAGKFLLLGNFYVVQASSGRTVVDLWTGRGTSTSSSFYANRRIAWVDTRGLRSWIRIYHLPVGRIEKSLRALRLGTGGILARPGGAVRVVYHIIGPTTDPEVIRQRLAQDIARRTMENHWHIASDGRLTVDITWHKLLGRRMQVWVRKEPFGIHAVNTGRIVRDDRVRLTIRLQRSKSGRIIRQWRTTMETPRFIPDAVNRQTLRDGVLEQADAELSNAAIPYFIPSSPSLISLPVYIR